MVGPNSGVTVGGKDSVVKAVGEADEAWLVPSGPGTINGLVCINIWSRSGMHFLFIGHLVELTPGGLPTYGCSVSGNLWRDIKMASVHKNASVDGKCSHQVIFH